VRTTGFCPHSRASGAYGPKQQCDDVMSVGVLMRTIMHIITHEDPHSRRIRTRHSALWHRLLLDACRDDFFVCGCLCSGASSDMSPLSINLTSKAVTGNWNVINRKRLWRTLMHSSEGTVESYDGGTWRDGGAVAWSDGALC
jgi:hypothetical protein